MATYCIACKTTPAYISYLGNCECSNPECKFYSPELYPPKTETENSDSDDLENEVTAKTNSNSVGNTIYFWSTRHDDFGDI